MGPEVYAPGFCLFPEVLQISIHMDQAANLSGSMRCPGLGSLEFIWSSGSCCLMDARTDSRYFVRGCMQFRAMPPYMIVCHHSLICMALQADQAGWPRLKYQNCLIPVLPKEAQRLHFEPSILCHQCLSMTSTFVTIYLHLPRLTGTREQHWARHLAVVYVSLVEMFMTIRLHLLRLTGTREQRWARHLAVVYVSLVAMFVIFACIGSG